MIHDISPLLTPRTPVWPGDVPLSQEWNLRIADGQSVNLSSLRATVHLGSHADAPLHYLRDGASIEVCPLEAYIGPARVIEVPREALDPEGRVLPGFIASQFRDVPPRVLLKTLTWAPDAPVGGFFASLHPDLVRELTGRGVILIGIDTPSVDPFDDAELKAHHALGRHRIMNLEGLDLRAVPPGDYELIALPLPLAGFDASPVRALLRTID